MIRVLYCDFDKNGKSKTRLSNVQFSKGAVEKFLGMKINDFPISSQNTACVYSSRKTCDRFPKGFGATVSVVALEWHGSDNKSFSKHDLQDSLFSACAPLGKMVVFQGFNLVVQ